MPTRSSRVAAIVRWILFLPVALSVFVATVFLAVAWAPLEHQDFLRAVGGALGAAASVFLGSRIAPSRRRAAAVMTALVLLLLVGFAFYAFFFISLLWTIGIGFGTFLALRYAAKNSRPRPANLSAEQTGQRYKGTAPFQDQEIDRRTFFGRARESRSLLSLVLAERLVVLFAKSGMGKTSLINAGLGEPLRARGYFPMTVRLADQEHGPLAAVFDGVGRAAREARVDCVSGDEKSLWHFFKTAEFWSESDDALRPVLILDQFEELFTLHTSDRRRELIGQLAELVRGLSAGTGQALHAGHLDGGPPDLKIVISLREDFLAHLEELARDIPGILHHRFRLGPLDRASAQAAIIEPARLADEAFKTVPFSYREEAVTQILAFLARQRHGDELVASDEAEPVQLQLICQYLEEEVRARQAASEGGREVEISEADVGGERHLQRVLESFYDRTLAGIGSLRELRGVRRLCEKRLISSGGRRLTEDEDEIRRKLRVSSKRLRQLVDARLLRAESRLGGVFYELSHDTLVEPIIQSRKRRIRRRQWTAAAAASGLFLVLASWWVTSGQRQFLRRQQERDAEVSALIVKGVGGLEAPDPYLALAEAKLQEIEDGYPEWVRSRTIYGAMAFVLEDVAHRYPDLRDRTRDIGEKIRQSFNQEHGVTPPTAAEDQKLNQRVLILDGQFLMGSPEGEGDDDEHPQHRVTLSAFYIQKHEVTNAEYRRFDPSNEYLRFDPSHAPLAPGNHPAVSVSWFEAMAYAAWLGGRLPTEAEWEYAARAGCPHPYCDRNGKETTLDNVGWYDGNSTKLHPVMQLEPNPWGLYDLCGNVWEWVTDWYGEYGDAPQVDPWGPSGGEYRVIRGGGFGSDAQRARAAIRYWGDPEIVYVDLGFRVVLPAAPSS